ncbi:MAG: TIGR01777 family oxidoreductase [Gemmatimonadales bacterium]
MRLTFSSDLPVGAGEAYAWHERPGAFERLVPPWQAVRLSGPHPGIADGTVARFELALGPFRRSWVARHRDVLPGRQFVDEQVTGPFATWVHRHRFEPTTADRSRLIDEIDFTLPFGPIGHLVRGLAGSQIRRAFHYRHATTIADLGFHQGFQNHPRLTVAVTGASGLIGRAVGAMLTGAGHQVIPLVRRPPGPGERRWDPGAPVDPATFAGVDAVIHLAGENIAAGRWTAARKAAIRSSRLAGTASLVEAIRHAPTKPTAFVSASAIGFYGDRGDQPLTERDGAGGGFLGELAVAWEAPTLPLADLGVRVATTRFGIVLSPAGGALEKMLLPFQLGLGARLGSGRQWMSWISIDDCAAAIIHALLAGLTGPINLTAPEPVTNGDFTRALGGVLHRPAVLAAPAPVLRLALGELADEGLLASARVLPRVLLDSGYRFRHPTIGEALRHLLGRAGP